MLRLSQSLYSLSSYLFPVSLITRPLPLSLFFFFNDTATTEIYTLSLHDALPICKDAVAKSDDPFIKLALAVDADARALRKDRKSTRLNSSHQIISYAVFCLKKKKTTI